MVWSGLREGVLSRSSSPLTPHLHVGTCVCVHVRVHVRLSVHSLARAGSIPLPPALPVGQSKEDPALGFQHLSPSLLRPVVPSVWKGKCVL